MVVKEKITLVKILYTPLGLKEGVLIPLSVVSCDLKAEALLLTDTWMETTEKLPRKTILYFELHT